MCFLLDEHLCQTAVAVSYDIRKIDYDHSVSNVSLICHQTELILSAVI